MDLASLRQLIRLIAGSTGSTRVHKRRVSEASTTVTTFSGAGLEPSGFLDPDADNSDGSDNAAGDSPYQPATSPRFDKSSASERGNGKGSSSSRLNPDNLQAACEGSECEDEDDEYEGLPRVTAEGKRKKKLRREASGISALGGVPAMPLGASAQYPAQSVGVTSYVRPKGSRKRRRRSRKTR